MKHDANDPLEQSPHAIAALLARYRASGLGLARFAQQEGLPAGRLH